MLRRSFLALSAALAAAASAPSALRIARAGVLVYARRPVLVGDAGGCASHRAGSKSVRARMARGFRASDFV